MVASGFISWMKSRAAEGMTSFAVPLDKGSDAETAGAFFKPNDVYLEVRVKQIWLANERELWREFQPFAAVVAEFTQSGQRRVQPALLGASQLGSKLSLVSDKDAIEIRNLRVVGPTPYEGEDLSLLIALFRTQTRNRLTDTINLIATVAEAIGAPGVSSVRPAVDAVASAITGFLGQDGVELRCGQYQSWSRAEDVGNPGTTDLAPMHYVVMRRPTGSGGLDPARDFAVRDGKLCRRSGSEFVPFTEHDFIMLSIEQHRLRDDYKRLAFYEYWQLTQNAIIHGELVTAERMWRRTAGALYTDELTAAQQEVLYAEYRARYEQMLDRFAQADERAFRGLESKVPGLLADEQDPRDILLAWQS
jgi:hypothetical protein